MVTSSNFRRKVLNKIAQTTTNTSTTAISVDTNTNTGSTTSVSPPPNFRASDIYGWMVGMYNSQTINILNSLIALLNMSLHYTSNGQYNFQILKNENFQIDSSGIPSIDVKNLLNLSTLIFKTYLNSGNSFSQRVTPQQIQTWNSLITNSQPFNNLSQLSPTGTIAQKVPGNFKDNILNFLRYLVMYNSP